MAFLIIRYTFLFATFCLGSFQLLIAQEIFAPDSADSDRFGRHKDNFFLITSTSQASEVKFQFSVKYRLMDGSGLYLGFTQQSFWNMWDWDLSSPFTESNYNPEIFYDLARCNAGHREIYRLGFEHESNGKAGAESRSLNRIYASSFLELVDRLIWIRPKLWIPIIVENQNDNIRQYEGNASLIVKIAYPGHPDLLALQVELRKGANLDFRKGAFVVNLGFRPLTIFGLDGIDVLNGSAFIQYWNGVGESLIKFDSVEKTLRFGFVLVR